MFKKSPLLYGLRRSIYKCVNRRPPRDPILRNISIPRPNISFLILTVILDNTLHECIKIRRYNKGNKIFTSATNTIYFQSTTNKMQRFSNLFISVRRCTCFRRFFRLSSGAQNCTYSVRYLSHQNCCLLLAWPG